MKKILFLAFAVLLCLGCSKEEENDDQNVQTITNNSGVDWYSAQVFFKSVSIGFPTSYSDVGTVRVGEECRVASEEKYFYIYAKDAQGNRIISKDIELVKASVVSAEDLTQE